MRSLLNKKINLLSIFLFIIVSTSIVRYVFLFPISPDSYIHLGIGKFIIEKNFIPQHTDISFKKTSLSLEWITHSWLSDSIIYLSSEKHLQTGVALLILPILFITLFIIYQICKLYEVNKQTIFIVLSTCMLLSLTFLKLHPILLTLPLSSLILLIYFLYKKKNKFIILILPLIFLLWANMYGGLIIIPAIICLSMLISEIYYLYIHKDRFSKVFPSFLLFLIVLSISLVLTLLNPYTFRIWLYTLSAIAILQTKSWLSTLPGSLLLINQSFIREPTSTLLQFSFLIYAGYITISVFILIVYKRFTFINQAFIFLPCLIGLMFGFFWIRLIPLSVMLSSPLFGYLIQDYANSHKKIGAYFMSAIALCITTVSIYVLIYPPRSIITEYPQKQIDLIKKYNLPGNILTTPDITGFLLYNDINKKVLLDAQDDFFDENETLGILYLGNVVKEQSLQNIISTNNVNTALVSKDIGGLAMAFNKHSDFSLLYLDYDGFLFVDKGTMLPEFISDNSILSIDLSRNLGFNPQVATASAKELENFISKYPESKLAIGQLASIYRYLDRPEDAELTLLKIPKDKWDYIVYTEMGRIKAVQGKCIESENYYLQALNDRREQKYSRAILDLAVLYALCFKDKEKATHFFNRYNSFILDPLERENVRQLSHDLQINLSE